tara:strand:- start:1649 stop:1879 length:231 start_codon:yes stop_codon:yes gene_type:complete
MEKSGMVGRFNINQGDTNGENTIEEYNKKIELFEAKIKSMTDECNQLKDELLILRKKVYFDDKLSIQSMSKYLDKI